MPSFDSVKVAARTLCKQPGFASVVIVSLALAIALNTTMYGILDALIHPVVDIRDPQSLYSIELYSVAKLPLRDLQVDSLVRANVPAVEELTPFLSEAGAAVFRAGNNYVEATISSATVGYFNTIGPRVLHGRTFIGADTMAEITPIVIGEALAEKLFSPGADPVGQHVTIDSVQHVVVGVLTRRAALSRERTLAWRIARTPSSFRYARMIRLARGTDVQDVVRQLKRITDHIALRTGQSPRYVEFRFHHPADPEFQMRLFNYALVVSVAALLLVACANVANMQLARGITRRRELALRTALGATRGRIVGHLLLESAILAVTGLVLGLLMTMSFGAILKATIPPAVGSYVVEPQMSWRVLAFAIAATLACIVLVGVAPAIRVSRIDPNEMLKSGAGTGATKRHRRQYGYLVAVEIALALGLLSGASLLVRAAVNAGNVYTYDPMPLVSGYVIQRVPYGRASLSDILQSTALRLGAVNGVGAVGTAYHRSLLGGAAVISDPGRGIREIAAPRYSYDAVNPDYLRAMGLPILRGRNFLPIERDAAGVIIDEFTAMSLWPGADPIGATIKLGASKTNEPFVRVVGVVATELRRSPLPSTTAEVRLGRIYYLPGPQDSVTVDVQHPPFLGYTVRGTKELPSLPSRMRLAGVLTAQSVGDVVRREQANRNFIANLFGLFAALGVALAAFGVYGVVAHSVAERRRELGVRIALGASARDILHAVLRESVVIALAGLALGLLATKYGVPLLKTFAMEDDLYNAPLFAVAGICLIATAAISAFIPARRATLVDPTESLRSE